MLLSACGNVTGDQTDVGVSQDLAQDTESTDQGTPTDEGAPADQGTPADQGAPADAGTPTDAGTPADAGVPGTDTTITDQGTTSSCNEGCQTPFVCDEANGMCIFGLSGGGQLSLIHI